MEDLSPEQLRETIGRNQTRGIVVAALGAIGWFVGFVLISRLFAPIDRSWALPIGILFLGGGLFAVVLPLYLFNRRLAPRCRVCRYHLTDEGVVDEGECPRCRMKLFR